MIPKLCGIVRSEVLQRSSLLRITHRLQQVGHLLLDLQDQAVRGRQCVLRDVLWGVGTSSSSVHFPLARAAPGTALSLSTPVPGEAGISCSSWPPISSSSSSYSACPPRSLAISLLAAAILSAPPSSPAPVPVLLAPSRPREHRKNRGPPPGSQNAPEPTTAHNNNSRRAGLPAAAMEWSPRSRWSTSRVTNESDSSHCEKLVPRVRGVRPGCTAFLHVLAPPPPRGVWECVVGRGWARGMPADRSLHLGEKSAIHSSRLLRRLWDPWASPTQVAGIRNLRAAGAEGGGKTRRYEKSLIVCPSTCLISPPLASLSTLHRPQQSLCLQIDK